MPWGGVGAAWDYEILTDRPEEVTVRFWVRTQRFPFYLERTVSLRSQESILRFHEVVRNESKTPLDFMWGHHPTFGRPFLDEQCVLTAPLPLRCRSAEQAGSLAGRSRRNRPQPAGAPKVQ